MTKDWDHWRGTLKWFGGLYLGLVPIFDSESQLERFFMHDLQGEDNNLKHLRQDGDIIGKVKISKYIMIHRYTKETTVWGTTVNPIDWL